MVENTDTYFDQNLHGNSIVKLPIIVAPIFMSDKQKELMNGLSNLKQT